LRRCETPYYTLCFYLESRVQAIEFEGEKDPIERCKEIIVEGMLILSFTNVFVVILLSKAAAKWIKHMLGLS
jgi:hypothetical protein